MQVIIHCGLDKAGSTAIQAHLPLYRQWLMDNGVYLPVTGLSGFGHVALFRDLSAQNWQPLLDELRRADQKVFTRCFLSYEGVCYFDQADLARINDYLQDYEVSVLFYLREQAEILQSGYLQALKTARNPLSIAHLNEDPSLLELPGRDYSRMLQKFETVFGRDRIAARVYRPHAWRDGSIIWDFLEFLGCPADQHFTPARQRQNISLDLESAEVLNVFDSYGADVPGREALVEDLLWLIQRFPAGSKYFLDEPAVQHIRTFYRDSNAALAQRYGVNFDYSSCVADRSAGSGRGGDAGRRSYIDELASLASSPRWKGEQLEGPQLASLLQFRPGWSSLEPWGVWSLGRVSRIEFRLPLPRFIGFEDSLILEFRGRYFSHNFSTRILVNGHPLDDCDLRECALKIPFRWLDDNRVVRLELRHQEAISPAALGISDDRRELAFGLERLAYRLST